MQPVHRWGRSTGDILHLVYELDPDGRQLQVVRYTDYAAEAVRTLCPTAPALREQWSDPTKRSEIIQGLAERGVSFDELAEVAQQPDADPFDLLCHLAFNAPSRDAVDAFHSAALGAGGSDNGAPGLRPHYGPTYYAAFVTPGQGIAVQWRTAQGATTSQILVAQALHRDWTDP